MRKLSVFALSVALLLLVGCASKPEQELAAAQKAIEAAKAAEGDIYSAEGYQAAADALKDAEAEIAAQDQKSAFSRNFDKARQLLVNAKTQADAAAESAAANKERVKGEAQTAQTEVATAIEEAKKLLAKAPKGKGTKADLAALQGDLTAAETALNDAKTAFDAGKYMDASNALKAVKEKVGTITADIQQAMQKKRVG